MLWGWGLQYFALLFRPQVHKMTLIKNLSVKFSQWKLQWICRVRGGGRVLFLLFSLNLKAVSPLPFSDSQDKFPQLFQGMKLLVSFQPMCMFVHSTLIKISSITPLEMFSIPCCEGDWWEALFLGFSN